MEKKILNTPLTEEKVRGLNCGDRIWLNGHLFTARDAAHQKMIELAKNHRGLPFSPEGQGLFHCGPLAKKQEERWKILAAGPTTSQRLESVEPEFLQLFQPRVIIGKGGMGRATLQALEKVGAVYTQYTGGCAALAAGKIEKVRDCIWLEELGMAEAVWLLEVEEFGPLTVTMDSHGRNLHAQIYEQSRHKLNQYREDFDDGRGE